MLSTRTPVPRIRSRRGLTHSPLEVVLFFPLTPNEAFGGMLMVTRRGADSYAASIVTRAAFIPCIGARDDATSEALIAAFETQSIKTVKSLRRDASPDATAWCVGSGWWLSTSEHPGYLD